jgi:hypothetical protein
MNKPVNIIINTEELFYFGGNDIYNVDMPQAEFERLVEETVRQAVEKAKQQNNVNSKNDIKSKNAKTIQDKDKSKSSTGAVFTTYIFSNDYGIEYLKAAAKQAELVDRLNGITNTKVIAVTEEFLKTNTSLNPDTDLIYEITNSPQSPDVSTFDPLMDVGITYNNGSSGRNFQNKEFVGGEVMANRIPPGYMQTDKYSAIDLGNLIDHERIAHGFKMLVRDLFSSGTGLEERLKHTTLSSTYGDDFRVGNYNGIERPVGESGDYVRNGKYTQLRDKEKYANQSVETINDLSTYISHKTAMLEAMKLKDSIFGNLADFKSLNYNSNSFYTEMLNNYFKDILNNQSNKP